MGFDLANFADDGLDADYVAYLVERQAAETAERFARLWDYFRNPLIAAAAATSGALNTNSRPYFQAQEVGLPTRITGIQRTAGVERTSHLQRKEVVIENDIAWRVQAMIDFLFGRDVTIRSCCADEELAGVIEQAVAAMFDANGGVALLQEMALFGSVYGFVDVALRTPAGGTAVSPPVSELLPPSTAAAKGSSEAARRPGTSDSDSDIGAEPSATVEGGHTGPTGDRSRIRATRAIAAARQLQLETVEAPRVVPILDEDDYRTTRQWVQTYRKHAARLDVRGNGRPPLPWSRAGGSSPAVVEAVEILSPTWWQRYEDRRLIAEGPNALGRLPVVHIQNMALPGSYAGMGDVEPLVPLQDELNTRLSDRAHRVTFQAFKMYLGKGIDEFLSRPVGPGQMWSTQNMDASIQEFGSDSGSPSEDIHIDQCRQALDKVSGVSALAAGLIRGNVGNLTSAAALKVLLSGLLAKTARKRLTYGAGIARIAELALAWLDLTGVLPTTRDQRRIEVQWPSPLPADDGEQLRNAQIKAQLGVPTDRILAELGYDRQSLNH